MHRCDKRCYDTCAWDDEYIQELFNKRHKYLKRNNIEVGSRIIYNSWPGNKKYKDRFAVVIEIPKSGQPKLKFDDGSISGKTAFDCYPIKEETKEKYLSPFSNRWV